MGNALFTSSMVVLALNIAAAAIALSVIGFVVGRIPRLIGLPLQHGLLCVVVILTLLSPVPIWLSYRCGLGLMTYSYGILERNGINEDSFDSSSKHAAEGVLPHRTSPNQTTDNDAVINNTESGKKTRSSGLPTPRETVGVFIFQSSGSLLILVWGAIAFWHTIRLARAIYVVRQIQLSLTPPIDPRVIVAAEQAFCAAGVSSKVGIFESTLVPAPLTLGWRRSSVVMPHGLADVLDEKQLTCILAHEVAHIVRRDTMIALLQQFAAALFWWNPLLRKVNEQISQLRERLCDDCVVMQHGDGMPLAESIVQVAQWSATRTLSPPLSLALLEGFSDLEDRVHRLVNENRTMSIHLSKESTAMLGVLSVVLGIILLLPVVRAQEGESKPTATKKSESPSEESKSVGNVERKSEAANSQTFSSDDSPKATDRIVGIDADETAAIAKIELLGGKVERKDKLISVSFAGNEKFGDNEMRLLKPLKNVKTLQLQSTKITDEGLKELKGLQITALLLYDNQITDVGLKELRDHKNLYNLYLGKTKITDNGLTELVGLQNLGQLDLGGSQITDKGLKTISELKNLGELNLSSTRISDAGLQELSNLPKLEYILLKNTQITDLGLKTMKEFKELRALDLRRTQITDAGLKEFKDFKKLFWVMLNDTKVTDKGFKELVDSKLIQQVDR